MLMMVMMMMMRLLLLLKLMIHAGDGGDDDRRQYNVSPRVQTRVRSSTERILTNIRRVPRLSPDIEFHRRRNFRHSCRRHVRPRVSKSVQTYTVLQNQIVCNRLDVRSREIFLIKNQPRRLILG